jgi:ApaG protein
MYIQTTRSIKVTAVPLYMADQSDPAGQRYVWAYTIQIENLGSEAVQLLDRYWHITNAMGQVQEVRGEGVVGEQPVLQAGEFFQYTSGAALTTASGMMVGHYGMRQVANGERFDVAVPAFSLDSPYETTRPN